MSTPVEHIKHDDDHDSHGTHQVHAMLEVVETVHEHIKYSNCEPSQKAEEQIKLMYAGVGAVVVGVGATAVTPAVRLIPVVGDHLADGLIAGGAIVGAAKGNEIAKKHISDHNLKCTDKVAYEAKMAAERAADTKQFKEVLHNVGALVLGTELEKKAKAQQEANRAPRPASTTTPSAPRDPLRPRRVLTPEQRAIKVARILESANRIQDQQREAAAIAARPTAASHWLFKAPPAPAPTPAPAPVNRPTVVAQVTHNSVYVGFSVGIGGGSQPRGNPQCIAGQRNQQSMMRGGRW